MIEVKSVEKYYAGKKALHEINFTVNEGEILGFLGPNGAGKSTTMNIITGYIAPTKGTVEIGGCDIMRNPKGAKSKIGYLPEHPPLYLDMTVRKYLDFVYDLKKVKMFVKNDHIKEICQKVGIVDVYDKIIKKLSKGYKQRIGIAQALIGYPEVIILDEPTVGLDPKQVISIRNLIKGLAKKHTVIFSSHILSEVQAVCNRILVINEGKIVADSPAEYFATQKSDKIIAQIEGEPDDVRKTIENVHGVRQIDDITNKDDGIYEYIVSFEKGCDIRKDMFKELAKNDMTIIKFDIVEPSLEDIFIELTSEKKEDKTNDEDNDNSNKIDDDEKSDVEDEGNNEEPYETNVISDDTSEQDDDCDRDGNEQKESDNNDSDI